MPCSSAKLLLIALLPRFHVFTSQINMIQKIVQPPKPHFWTKSWHNWIVVPPLLLKPTFSENRRGHSRNGYGQNCFGSKRGYSVHAGSSSTGDEKQVIVVANFQENKAPEWSSPITCSNSPLSESNNMSKFECTKDQVEKQNKFQCVEIYWVLVSLAVTVFWGKINVIIWIPILLCFFPLWNASCCWLKGIPKLWDAESKVDQKSHRDRVGMSDRNKERLQWAWNLFAKILVFVLEGFL
ncbi:hypothetical protein VNO80_27435 [Phaseolus coccineus]|uniref:Uncharacterized protein n=1 Tax=Phaseolus coccineus TaxID=3886 RepID=A0AAN9LGN6_PHACN